MWPLSLMSMIADVPYQNLLWLNSFIDYHRDDHRGDAFSYSVLILSDFCSYIRYYQNLYISPFGKKLIEIIVTLVMMRVDASVLVVYVFASFALNRLCCSVSPVDVRIHCINLKGSSLRWNHFARGVSHKTVLVRNLFLLPCCFVWSYIRLGLLARLCLAIGIYLFFVFH